MKNHNKKKIEWSSPSLLPKELIFIDGVTRSGKSMLGPVISSLNKTYPTQQQTLLDNLLPIYAAKYINKNVFKSLINFYFNKNLYYMNISREINLRPDDASSFVHHKDFKLFKKNLKSTEGDHVIKNIKKKNYYPVFMTHDLLSMLTDFNEINVPYKLLYIYRHPIDNIFSFFKRYQLRMSSKNNTKYNLDDPRIHQMMIKFKGKLLPYYTLKEEAYFSKLNFLEKSTFYYLQSINSSIKTYKKLNKNQRKKILLIKFDDFAEKIDLELNKISNFLGLKKTSHTKKILIRNNLPRKMFPNEREFKMSQLKKNISNELFKELNDLTEKYEKSSLFIRT